MCLANSPVHVVAQPYQPPPAGGAPPAPEAESPDVPEAESPDVPEAEEEHAQLDPSWIKVKRPSGKRQATSDVWQHVKELSDACPKKGPYTHVCTYALGDGRFCNKFLKLGWNKHTKGFTTSVAVRHCRDQHPESRAGKEALARIDQRQEKADGDMAAAGVAKAAPHLGYLLSKEDKALTFQARYMIYSRSSVRKSELESDVFRDMLRALGGKDTPILGVKSLVYYVNAEFNVFLKFLVEIIKVCTTKALGNPFLQYLHDGATLANKIKYQGVAVQFIDPTWKCNHVVALGLKRCPVGTDANVAALLDDVVKERLGFNLKELGAIMVSDRAASGVAKQAGMEEQESCLMHDGDKLGSSAVGQLVRTKNKVAVNPFPEGDVLIQNAINTAKHFSYGSRRIEKLHEFCKLTGEATIRPCVIKNGTRVAAFWRLLHSLLRMPRALHMYSQAYTDGALGWTPPGKAEAEFEAVLYVTQLTSQLAQCERFFNGAYRIVIISLTLNPLRERRKAIVDLSKPTTDFHLPRKPITMTEMSKTGQECFERALLEGERRFCTNNTEEINGSDIVMSKREKLATMLDLRTCKGTHLNTEQLNACKETLYEEYAKFKMQADATLLAKAQEIKAKRAADATEDSAAKRSKVTPKNLLGITYAMAYGDVSSESEAEQQETEPELDENAQRELYKAEAKRCLKEWRKLVIDWQKEYPEHKFNSKGKLYQKLETSNKYGYIPLMASCSHGQLGALNAESFIERIWSCAGIVMDEGNSLLSDLLLEKLTLLRMNKKFMDFMRDHHNDMAEQEFKMTVIRSPPSAPSSSPASSATSTPGPSSSSSTSTPGPSTSTGDDDEEWETPNSLDATEPRLEEEADADDWGVCTSSEQIFCSVLP